MGKKKLMHPFNFSLYFEFFFLKKNGQSNKEWCNVMGKK